MKIEHIAMYVQDLEKARDFFMKYFAAKSNAVYHNPNTDFKSCRSRGWKHRQRIRCGQDLSIWQSVSEAKNR